MSCCHLLTVIDADQVRAHLRVNGLEHLLLEIDEHEGAFVGGPDSQLIDRGHDRFSFLVGLNEHSWLRSRAIHSRMYRGQSSSSTPSNSCAARKRTTSRSTSVASQRLNTKCGRYRLTSA